MIVEIFVPNTPAPLIFSADFDPTSIRASGRLPPTNLDFGGSAGRAGLLVDDWFGTETLVFEPGSVGGLVFVSVSDQRTPSPPAGGLPPLDRFVFQGSDRRWRASI